MGILFWVLMILWLLFGVWTSWPAPGSDRTAWGGFGGTLLQFILFALLGWRIFGPPLQ